MVVYVLELAGDNYYVGRTNNLDQRLEQHKSGNGSAWTNKHRFIKLVETHDTDNPFYEDMMVKMLMKKHGINKVRGGTYSQVVLPNEKIQAIKNEINGALNKCFRCGGDHFVRDCSKKDDTIDDSKLDDLLPRIASSVYRKTKRLISYFWS